MFFCPRISHPLCERLGDFLPFGTGMSIMLMSGLLVAARVIAMYGGSKKLAVFLVTYLIAQAAATLYAFLYPGAGPLPLPDIPLDAYRACIQLTSPRLATASVVWIALDCGFDTIIITLTIFRSWQIYNALGRVGYIFKPGNEEWYERPSLAARLVQDGLLYFLVLIMMNCTWMVMAIAATPGLKWICAMPALAMIVTMVSRITLNLRAHVYGRDEFLTTLRSKPHMSFYKPGRAGHGDREREREAAARAAGGIPGRAGRSNSQRTFLDGMRTFENHYLGRAGGVEMEVVVEVEMDDMGKQTQLPADSSSKPPQLTLAGIPPYSTTDPDSLPAREDEFDPDRAGFEEDLTEERNGLEGSGEWKPKRFETTSRLGRDVIIM